MELVDILELSLTLMMVFRVTVNHISSFQFQIYTHRLNKCLSISTVNVLTQVTSEVWK